MITAKDNDLRKTSEMVRESALYVTECCNIESTLQKYATFTRCPECEGLTQWELVRPVRAPQKAA